MYMATLADRPGSVVQRHVDLPRIDLDGMARSVLGGRHAKRLTGPNIELPTVPVANQTLAVALYNSGRPAVAASHIFIARRNTTHMHQKHQPLVAIRRGGVVGSNLVPWTNIMKRRHSLWLFHSYCRT